MQFIAPDVRDVRTGVKPRGWAKDEDGAYWPVPVGSGSPVIGFASIEARLSRIGAATAPIDTEHQHGQSEELARAGVGDVMKHPRDDAPADNKHDDKKGGQSDQRQPERTQKSMGFHESEQTALARATCALLGADRLL